MLWTWLSQVPVLGAILRRQGCGRQTQDNMDIAVPTPTKNTSCESYLCFPDAFRGFCWPLKRWDDWINSDSMGCGSFFLGRKRYSNRTYDKFVGAKEISTVFPYGKLPVTKLNGKDTIQLYSAVVLSWNCLLSYILGAVTVQCPAWKIARHVQGRMLGILRYYHVISLPVITLCRYFLQSGCLRPSFLRYWWLLEKRSSNECGKSILGWLGIVTEREHMVVKVGTCDVHAKHVRWSTVTSLGIRLCHVFSCVVTDVYYLAPS